MSPTFSMKNRRVWLVDHVPNSNQRVGMIAETATSAPLDPHPALKVRSGARCGHHRTQRCERAGVYE